MASDALFLAVTPLVPAGPDLEETLRFYIRELGFEVTWRGGDMAGLRRGRVELHLVQNTNRAWAENSSLSIGVTDLDAVYEEYHNVRARVGPLEVKTSGRREFHMILSSGVCLQFYEGDATAGGAN